VQQAVETAETEKSAVVGEVLDDALDDHALAQVLHLVGAGAVFGFKNRAPRDDDIAAVAVEFDDLEFQFLAFQIGEVAHRAHVHQRAGQKRADAVEVHDETALDLVQQKPLDDVAALARLFKARPGADVARALARQQRLAEAVLKAVQRHFHDVALADLQFAVLVGELLDRNHALGLQPGVDDDRAFAYLYHLAFQQRAGLQALRFFVLIQEVLKIFIH